MGSGSGQIKPFLLYQNPEYFTGSDPAYDATGKYLEENFFFLSKYFSLMYNVKISSPPRRLTAGAADFSVLILQ
jgi:hypothetical protein